MSANRENGWWCRVARELKMGFVKIGEWPERRGGRRLQYLHIS